MDDFISLKDCLQLLKIIPWFPSTHRQHKPCMPWGCPLKAGRGRFQHLGEGGSPWSCSPGEDRLTAEEMGHPRALPSNPEQSPNHPAMNQRMTVTFKPIYNEEARKLVTKTLLDSGPAQSLPPEHQRARSRAAGPCCQNPESEPQRARHSHSRLARKSHTFMTLSVTVCEMPFAVV